MEETVKMLHEDISRLRSELEYVRMKKKDQIVHDQEMSKATWELSTIQKEAGKNLERANSLQGSLRNEQEKSKCLLRSIETAERNLGYSANAGEKLDLDAFLKFLSTSNKSSQDNIEKLSLSLRKTSKGQVDLTRTERLLFCDAEAHHRFSRRSGHAGSFLEALPTYLK